ncbi:tachykinin-like peptides receptor 99D [Tetranychus urticae]|uniref:G-protein coupled receptors family 1 profile domain-containing protein n=1 Tax=Tetranychus urticae TaxID=32264 RepID=T1JW77_TETUR|nr:tachykinin-like peptides receptor 99D [Tetranychus urticae]
MDITRYKFGITNSSSLVSASSYLIKSILTNVSPSASPLSLTSLPSSPLSSIVVLPPSSSSSTSPPSPLPPSEASLSGDESIDNSEASSEGIYQIPPLMIVFLTSIYLLVSLCAVIGNSMVLWIVIKSKRMRNVTNFFIANLAVADLVIASLAVPFQFPAALLQRWVLPHFMCSLCPTAQVVSVNVSIFTLVAISLDRHQAVTRPLATRMYKKSALFIIAFIWLISLLLATPTFVAWEVRYVWSTESSNYTEPFCDTSSVSSDFWRHYNHFLVALQYFIPLFVISFAYIHMAVILSEVDATTAKRNDYMRALQNKRRVIKMLFIVVALFAICWLPFQLYNILQEIYPSINEYKYINVIWFSCHWLSMSNSCYNPFIYAIYGERFKAEFVARFRICRVLRKCMVTDDKSTNGLTYSFTGRKFADTSLYKKSIGSSAAAE